LSLFSQFTSRAGGDIMVYFGGGRRDIVKGMSIAEVYRTQPELQAVVSFVSRSIAQLPLKCYVREEDNSRVRDTEGPLATLLANPAPDMTTFDLVLSLVGDLKLYGWALWWVVPSASAPSGRELRAIPPDWAKIKTEDGFTPSAYVLSNPATNGRQITVPADQFVRFATYNPGQPLTPLSPVESLRDVLSERASSRDYRGKIWRNGGWFSRYIKRPLQAPDWAKGGENSPKARFARSWKARFAGSGGTDTGGTPILEDGMELVESRINAKEAEWAESMRLTREDVAAAYHLNPAQVWSNEGQTYASVKENARSLYADTLGPDLTLIQDCINTKLAPMVGEDPRCYAEFDLSAKLAGSFEEQASVLSQSVGGPYMTRNEARARQNLPAIEGGDELIVPLNVTEGGLASPHDTDPTKAAWVPSIQEDVVPALPQRKAAPAEVVLGSDAPDEYVSKLEETLRAFYERQATSLANSLSGVSWDDIILIGKESDVFRGKERWVRELADDLRAAGLPQAEAAARRALSELGSDPEELDVDGLGDQVRRLCRQRSDDVVQSTLERLCDDLFELWRRGEGEWKPEAVRSCVSESYQRLMDSRVERNARSLATAASNAGTVEGARQSGSPCEKEWVTGPNARPSHAALNGKRVKVGNTFMVGKHLAMWPGDPDLPAHESCNCNCRIKIVSGGNVPRGSRTSEVAEELGLDDYEDERLDAAITNCQRTVGYGDRRWDELTPAETEQVLDELRKRYPDWVAFGRPAPVDYSSKPRESLYSHEAKAIDYLSEQHGIALSTILEDDDAVANLDLMIGDYGWELKSPKSGKHAVDDRLTDAFHKFRKLGDNNPRIIICNSESTRPDADVLDECLRRIRHRKETDRLESISFLFLSHDGKTLLRYKI